MIARADNAARDLLARLADGAALETAPIDEIRADLALLGVDPLRTIRFSRRLAEQASSPAGGLLAKALAAEDDEREVAALERADGSAVRAELSAASPVAAARSQQLAAQVAATARRRTSRRLWYGFGGAITAIAASLLLFIVWSPPERVLQQMAFEPDAAPMAQRSNEKQSDAPAVPTAPTAAAPSIPELAESLQRYADSAGASRQGAPPEDAAAQNAGGGANGTVLAEGGLSVQGTTEQAGATLLRTRSVAWAGTADLRVVAALILQPELTPEPLRQADLGAGDLAARLPEAARHPGRKYIIALLTWQQADGRKVDGMLMRLRVENLQALKAPEGEIANQDAVSRTAIEPPSSAATPTLRQLLGKDINGFYLADMPPPAATQPK